MKNTQVILANQARRRAGAPTFRGARGRMSPAPARGRCWCGSPIGRSTRPCGAGPMTCRTILRPVRLGDPMRSFAVGDVIASRHPDYAEGDVVTGLLGWQTHALVDGASIARKVTETDLPRTYALGHSRAQRDDGLFRSDAKAARRRRGTRSWCPRRQGRWAPPWARSRGISRLPHRGDRGRRGEEATVPGGVRIRRSHRLQGRGRGGGIAAHCPEGVDCYFDNTCGPISDAVMTRLAQGARITICGTAAVTEWDPVPMGPRVHRQLLVARARMEGFLIFDYRTGCRRRAMRWPVGCAREADGAGAHPRREAAGRDRHALSRRESAS
jgi:hypothetical protein